nr:hypothetical protein [Dyella sp. ASV24]
MKTENLIDNNYQNIITNLPTEGFALPHPKVIKVRNDLLQAGPYRFFGTLTFQYHVSEQQAREFASKHWRKTQRELLGRNWIGRSIPQMTGIAVMERAAIFITCMANLLLAGIPQEIRERWGR